MHPFCNLQSRARTHPVLVIGLYELLGTQTTLRLSVVQRKVNIYIARTEKMNIFSSKVDFKINNNKLAEFVNLTLHFFTLQVFSFGFILKLSHCSERKEDKTQIDQLRLSYPHRLLSLLLF